MVAAGRRPGAPGRHPGRRAGRGAQGGRGRWRHRLEADAENALLPARHAVRARPRPARNPVPRVRHRRVRAWRRRLRQLAADRRTAAAARRRSRAAAVPHLRRPAPADPHGARRHRSRGLPARPGAPRQAVRRTRPGRIAGLRRRRAGPGRAAALGRALRRRAAARIALCLLGRRDQAVLHRAARAGGPVRGHRDAVRRAPARSAGVVLACRRARRAGRKPGRRDAGASLPRPVRARRQAKRRLGRQRAQPTPRARRSADAGRLPDVQLLAPQWRQGRAAHAR
ncbi:Uncharacterised protein [Bordetella pertussis]|nr:Uncharacterised protein [Bordetella pertussis]CFT90090.1 Uncharacterised protein [Bordetella pertussis]CPO89956.1 Uncharacterised protein [Bordetella pertussis]